jgi:uncharacterized protein YecE (DUF72 family)
MVFERDSIAAELAAWAARGAHLGTSSWKYPGWRGQLYTDDRYIWRGSYSQSRFERLCLAEYAEVFKTVCVDAAYYRFPDARFVESTFGATPADFLFGLKVTDRITVKHFPNLPRFGGEAGCANPDFLNPEMFNTCFIDPIKDYRHRVGLLIFEFSKFHAEDYQAGREFVQDLDQFLGVLPPVFPYGVEIRNRNFLRPEYFEVLTRHGVAHIYNSWQDMPPVGEQLSLPGSRTSETLCGARMLLRPGRRYEEAVKAFSPYSEIKDPYPEGQDDAAQVLRSVVQSGGKTRGFIYVNNRFEGNALHTIAGILEKLKRGS